LKAATVSLLMITSSSTAGTSSTNSLPVPYNFIFFTALILAMYFLLIRKIIDITWDTIAGFLAGIWIFYATAIHSLFEIKHWRLIFINGGYSVVALTLMGAIIGLWR